MNEPKPRNPNNGARRAKPPAAIATTVPDEVALGPQVKLRLGI
jgi:hypothetical protein